MIQRFKSASRRIRRAFTPPPSRRGSENQDSGHSDVQMQIQENHVIQNVSATSRWWTFIAFIMAVMHFMVRGYQLSIAMFKKVKQFTVMLVNVNQVSVTIIAIINQRRRQVQRRNQSRQSRQTRQSRLQYFCTFILFSALFATCILIVFHFMSLNPSVISIILLDSRLELSRVISLSKCCICCQLQLSPSPQEWQQHQLSPSMKRQLKLLSQFRV